MPANPEVRAQRVRDGICAQCGDKPAAKGSQYCKAHRAKRNAAANEKQKRRVQDRHAAGKCCVAGCDRVLDTKWMCRLHQDLYNEYRQGYRR